jgi:hypothetical protein
MIGVVRYDGLLDLSLSRDYRRLTHPTFYLQQGNNSQFKEVPNNRTPPSNDNPEKALRREQIRQAT